MTDEPPPDAIGSHREERRRIERGRRRAAQRRVGLVVLGAAVVIAAVVGIVSAISGGGSGGDASATANRTPRSAPSTTPAKHAAKPASEFSSRQLAGQRLVVAFTGTTPPLALRHAIAQGEIGGVILYGDNITSVTQARALVDRLQKIQRPKGLRTPLLIAVDQEGGSVRRFPAEPPGATAAAMGAQDSVAQIEQVGHATARALLHAGVNVDLAPVADIDHPGSAIAAEQRVFGKTGAAAAFARGLVSGGVQATAKHFPGLGGATENTDQHAAQITLSRERLRSADESAFVSVIDAGARLVMVSNAIYTALDPKHPAGLSATVVGGELRGHIGYQGVTITDDLGAAALKPYGSAGELAVRAARAGVDLELIGNGFMDPLAAAAAARTALAHAIHTGQIPSAAAEATVARVQALRKLSAKP